MKWLTVGVTALVITMSAVMNTTIFAGATNGVYRSDNKGNTWTIVDDNVDPAVVVTVYRTSKIRKYWSGI